MICKYCKQEVPQELIEEEKPVIVGVTKKVMSFLRHHPIEIGTPIYEYKGELFVEHTLIYNNEVERVRFHKHKLGQL